MPQQDDTFFVYHRQDDVEVRSHTCAAGEPCSFARMSFVAAYLTMMQILQERVAFHDGMAQRFRDDIASAFKITPEQLDVTYGRNACADLYRPPAAIDGITTHGQD